MVPDVSHVRIDDKWGRELVRAYICVFGPVVKAVMATIVADYNHHATPDQR